jgi:nitrile hydratase beta subunit
MNSIHDLGGMHGLGPIQREENEPVFHAEWEKHVYAINRTRAWLGYNIDEMRHGIERMDPGRYLAATYYERWLDMLERMLAEKGVLTREEIDARTAFLRDHPEDEIPRREDPALLAQLEESLRAHPGFDREATSPPRFTVGDRVVTRHWQPVGHTRLPRYARGKRGTIHRVHGAYVFPDTNAHGAGEQPQWVYSVGFDGRELWDDSAEPRECLYLDLWESYLAPA